MNNNNINNSSNTFFADAVLDLEEAHGIADTPEPTRHRFDANVVHDMMLSFGDGDDDDDENINIDTRRRLEIPSLVQTTITTSMISKAQLPIEITTATSSSSSSSSIDNQKEDQIMDVDNQQLHLSTTTQNNAINTVTLSEEGMSGTSTSTSREAFENTLFNSATTSVQLNELVIDEENNKNEDNNATTDDDNFPRIASGRSVSDYYDIRSIPPPLRPPRWPRDIQWTIAFLLIVPFTLLYPITLEKHEAHLTPLTKRPLSTATIHALLWTCVATVLLCRLLYRSAGGPDGDDARNYAATVLTLAAPVSVVTYLLLSFVLFISCPKARWAALIPLFYTFRDVFLFRRWKRRTATIIASPNNTTTGFINTSGGYASRQAFFQALVCMSLDILARSLRRQSFYRVLTTILLLQLGVLLLWRWAILGALGSGSWSILLLTCIGGKWATGTIARTLTLLASGGVMNWCFHQSASIQQHHQQQKQQKQNEQQPQEEEGRITINGSTVDVDLNTTNNINGSYDYHDGILDNHPPNNNKISVGWDERVPEAYRTVDASVYQSVLAADDVLDDDFEDDDYYDGETTNASSPSRRRNGSTGGVITGSRLSSPKFYIGTNNSSHSFDNGSTGATSIINSRSTVKTILSTGLAISFGSIVHCGLLGGLAQFIWSLLRKVEAAQVVVSEQRQRRLQRLEQQRQKRDGSHRRGTSSSSRDSSTNGFQTMSIGDATTAPTMSFTERWNIWQRLKSYLREFVRDHSDLAMTHVVSYYKAYTKASRDVAYLIDESGIEPILHDDITTHICSCIGGTITGVIVILTGSVMLHHRTKTTDEFDDLSIVENMFVAFMLSYTLIFTVMEPLRASVKAVYVSFAHCPKSISQTYPLIYHRLCRISQSNIS